MKQHYLSLAVAAALLGASGMAVAQDWVLKASISRYTTDSATNGVTGVGIPAGADAETGNATTALLVVERRLDPNLGVELVLGVPPRIKARATGTVPFLGEVLSAKVIAPAVLVNYHFGSPTDSLRPYVGAGINYTKFGSVKTSYNWDVSLSDSVGWAAHVGLDYAVSREWGLWGSVAAARVKTDLVAIGNTVLQSTINFRPVVYSVGAFYRF